MNAGKSAAFLAAPVLIRYEEVTESAHGRSDATAPRNVMDPAALSGVASQTT